MRKPHDLKTFNGKFNNDVNQSKESRLGKGYTLKRIWRYLWSELNHLFHNYCSTTTVHGFRNITGKRLSFTENLIWATICFTAVSFCVVLLIFTYQSMQNRLSMIELKDLESPLHTLDFPAVTICNVNKVYKPKADYLRNKLLRAGFNKNDINLFFSNLPRLLRSDSRSKKENFDHVIFNKMLYTLTSDLKRFMNELMHPCEKLLQFCTWMGISYDCSKLFKKVDSFGGNCCGFNYHVFGSFADRQLSPQCKKFNENYNVDTRIYCTNESDCPGSVSVLKTPGSGVNVGLTVKLNLEPEMYLDSTRNYPAAYIIIHGPKDFPETDILTLTAQANYGINAVVSGTVIEALDEVKILSRDDRTCIFPGEIPYDYSYRTCLSVCKLKRIMAACNCKPYYYPVNCINTTAICDFKDIYCIQKYKYQITNLFERKTLDNGNILERCHCQPLCNTTSYRFVSLEKNYLFDSQNPPVVSKINLSVVNVFFRDYGYIKYEMRLFLSWNDLIARLGGLIGLCLGGSLISLMEPVIYLILTPFRRVHHREIRREREEAEAKKRAEEESKNKKNSNYQYLNLYRNHFM